MGLRNKQRNLQVGLMIKQYREKNNLTQKELAEKIDKSESTVRMWELGKSEPDLETLILLSEIFNTDVNDLLALDVAKYSLLGSTNAIIERPDYELDFLNKFGSLIVNKEFIDLAKLCKVMNNVQIGIILGFAINLLRNAGTDAQIILNS